MLFHLSPIAAAEGYGDAVLSLAAAKAHLRLEADENDGDALIGALRDAAIDAVEQLCGVRLGPTTGIVATFAGFCSRMRMPVGPMATVVVTAIEYVGSDGAPVTSLTSADWYVGSGGYLSPAVSKIWPIGGTNVKVTFSAGYPADALPPSLLSAVKLMLGHLYKNREAVVATGLTGELPLGVQTLCGPYRIMGL